MRKTDPSFLRAIVELRQSGLTQLVVLGANGITEDFHNKMETISRQAYGFLNFENYRQRVQVLSA